jgi:hypothetical protein
MSNDMLRRKTWFTFVSIFCVILLGPQWATGELKKEEVTIAVPQELMTEFINDTLPIKIERKTSFSGVIWIESIDRLKLGNDKISFSVAIHGENFGYKKKIGKRPVELEFGDVRLSFECEASIRYDKERNILFVMPEVIQERAEEQALVPLLAALIEGREFPIEVQELESIVTKIGNKSLTIDMDISNIFTLDSILFIGIRPKIRENRAVSKADHGEGKGQVSGGE